ncbi:arylamine N-acetyltransferase family protein [Hazenella coriacea]|uniref:N-hydroxyarylamine O-acetyltransferase n=1 Tax=Hazenella coriacea TaxID=1179467 RepID=A0A4R3L3K2_9BACL|nr:arylamine N-acetyltransferase [Hazenella coriacea]TCS93842.1 N-hydroxyarylamine O-acetyltransferase [Hazenella coriacea]
MDINQYLHRIHINQSDDHQNSLELLQKIHKHHLLYVPFENLDILLQRPLSMSPEQVFVKVVEEGRGGLCYEVNSLLYQVLHELGYQVDLISGGFWNSEKSSWDPECSHLALAVHLDRPYLFDVGVGGGFIHPIPFVNGHIYSDQSGDYRMDQDRSNQNLFILQKQEEGQWRDFIKFDTTPRNLEEFDEMCTQLQSDLNSIFTQSRVCSRLTENGRVSLSEEYLTITVHGEKKKYPIHSEEEWQQHLYDYFQIKYPR